MPLYVGAQAPEAYRLTVTSKDVDLTTVTAAKIIVRDPFGNESTWTATTSNATTNAIEVTHVMSGELVTEGDHYFFAELTVPGGTIRSTTVKRQVLARFGLSN
jgi:hypothetical protein